MHMFWPRVGLGIRALEKVLNEEPLSAKGREKLLCFMEIFLTTFQNRSEAPKVTSCKEVLSTNLL